MIDQYGLVVQEDGNPGDCPCRTGVVIIHKLMERDPISVAIATAAVKTLKINGSWVRYPTPPYNDSTSKEWGFSGDQASSLMLALGMTGFEDQVKQYYWSLAKNWFRHPNGDPFRLGEFLNLVRIFNLWPLYPLLVLLDLKFLFDVWIGAMVQPWDYQNLYVMSLVYSLKRMWTPSAWLAARLAPKQLMALLVRNNLINPWNMIFYCENNPCLEAGEANIWAINQLPN